VSGTAPQIVAAAAAAMLCRPHENLVTLHQWKLHGENRMQLLFDDDLLLLRLLSDSLYRCHQITDQCACVHSATSNWIPTTEPGTAAFSFSFLPADLCPLGRT
jgi:hypothetical protein